LRIVAAGRRWWLHCTEGCGGSAEGSRLGGREGIRGPEASHRCTPKWLLLLLLRLAKRLLLRLAERLLLRLAKRLAKRLLLWLAKRLLLRLAKWLL